MSYYAVERSTDHLAHYGVKGMRWGVRRALATGNQAALDRHYRRAARKLAKLQNIGNHPVKSGAKAAAYGAAAATTGALAIGGTGLASKGLQYISAGANTLKKSKFGTGKNGKIVRIGHKRKNVLYNVLEGTEKGAGNAAKAIDEWGKKATNIKINRKAIDPKTNTLVDKEFINKSIGNDKLFRLGAGLATAGLAAKAYQHGRRARNAEMYRDKAERWKQEMDNVFAGTDYEGQYAKVSARQQRKRRRYGG